LYFVKMLKSSSLTTQKIFNEKIFDYNVLESSQDKLQECNEK